MSWSEFFLTTLANMHKVFRKLSKKRWFRLCGVGEMFVIHNSHEDSSTNEELLELGFEVEDYREKIKGTK